MTRAFVAVVPPPEVLDSVEGQAEELTAQLRDARRTRRAQWHLTLQFLGDAVDLEVVAGALDAVRIGSGTLQLGGVGAFPSVRRARVCWVGVTEGGAWLRDVAMAVAALLAPIGYPAEPGDLLPHLTLARLRDPVDLRGVVEARRGPVGRRFEVNEIVLFESTLTAPGAHHRAHARYRLG